MNGIPVGNLRKREDQLIALGVPRRELRATNCSRRVQLTYGDGSTRTISKTAEMDAALVGATSAELI